MVRESLDGCGNHGGALMRGFVGSEQAVEGRAEVGDTAAVKVTIDRGSGSERLEQRLIRCASGRSKPRTLEDRQQVLFVVSGTGTLFLDGGAHGLEPDTGAYVAAGESFELDNPGPEELVVLAVSAPQEESRPGSEKRTVRYADRPTLPAGGDRKFSYLVDHEVGSRDVTQFLGEIAPGRAPDHSHVYDEVIYVIEGEGKLHLDGTETAISGGSCIYLPPLVEHCLENSGNYPMRVLGVFHPAGDPASRAYEATQ
jgi:mannose-6-phosphate isomerase-like protein (cupin superfamily)